jgi:hypothetical protein
MTPATTSEKTMNTQTTLPIARTVEIDHPTLGTVEQQQTLQLKDGRRLAYAVLEVPKEARRTLAVKVRGMLDDADLEMVEVFAVDEYDPSKYGTHLSRPDTFLFEMLCQASGAEAMTLAARHGLTEWVPEHLI